MPVKIFVDTNILLHFKPLEEIGWKEVIGEMNVTIVFAPIIIEEFDKHKRNTNVKIANRAKVVAKRIDESSASKKFSKSVEIDILTIRPNPNTFDQHSLDRLEQDDRLIASILEYKAKHSDQTVRLLTNDLGPKLKCISLGIETLDLPEKYELANDDEQTKEIRKLKEEINKLKEKIPKVEILFNDKSKINTFDISIPNFELFKETELKKIRDEKSQIDKKSIHLRFLSPFVTDHKIDIYKNRLSAY